MTSRRSEVLAGRSLGTRRAVAPRPIRPGPPDASVLGPAGAGSWSRSRAACRGCGRSLWRFHHAGAWWDNRTYVLPPWSGPTGGPMLPPSFAVSGVAARPGGNRAGPHDRTAWAHLLAGHRGSSSASSDLSPLPAPWGGRPHHWPDRGRSRSAGGVVPLAGGRRGGACRVVLGARWRQRLSLFAQGRAAQPEPDARPAPPAQPARDPARR
jgi:hypothetical protein